MSHRFDNKGGSDTHSEVDEDFPRGSNELDVANEVKVLTLREATQKLNAIHEDVRSCVTTGHFDSEGMDQTAAIMNELWDIKKMLKEGQRERARCLEVLGELVVLETQNRQSLKQLQRSQGEQAVAEGQLRKSQEDANKSLQEASMAWSVAFMLVAAISGIAIYLLIEKVSMFGRVQPACASL